MLPTKAKTFIEEFCQIYEYDNISDIEFILMEVYRDMKDHMIDMDWEAIAMPGMGLFFLKAWTLRSEIVSLGKRFSCKNKISDYNRELFRKKLDKYVPIVEKMDITFRARAAMRYVNRGELRKAVNVRPPHIEGIGEPSASAYNNKGCRCEGCTLKIREHQKLMRENRYKRIKNKLSQTNTNDTPGEIHEGLG